MVGVAIDIDARMMWFASNGEWDEEKAPSFGPETIPKGQGPCVHGMCTSCCT